MIMKFQDFLESKQQNKQDNKDNIAFFEKRKEGARAIASQARSKGGPAILTVWHFAAKDEPYREVIRAIKDGKSEKYYKDKYRTLFAQLTNPDLQQEKFQRIIGKLEVWGEAIAQLFNS
jgi:hypothetical protein